MKKTFFLNLILVLVLSFSFVNLQSNFNNVHASALEDFNYIALGDSITYGYGYNANAEAIQLENNYPKQILNNFTQYFNINDADDDINNLGINGLNTTNLINCFNGTYTYEEQSKFSISELDAIGDANVISLCIGANDVLGPAIGYLQANLFSLNQSELRTTIETSLNGFKGRFETIIDTIDDLLLGNSSLPQIFIMNVYNPYKNVLNFPIPVLIDITEDYLNGDSEQSIIGINQIIEEVIAEKAEVVEHCELNFVDISSAFDDYNGDDALVYAEKNNSSGGISLNMQDYDPHPTPAGQDLIALTVWNEIENTVSFPTNIDLISISGTIKEAYEFGIDTEISLAFESPVGASNVQWLILEPNSAKYINANGTSNTNSYSFVPNRAGIFNFKVRYVLNTETLYTNKLTINVSSQILPASSSLIISQQQVKNSKSEISAFKFIITNGGYYDVSSTKWYVSGVLTAIGETFVFEPELIGSYNVMAKITVPSGSSTKDIVSQQLSVTASVNKTALKLAIAGVVIGLLAIGVIISIVVSIRNERVWR